MSYAERLAKEQEIFRDQVEINDLPPIFHYWSNKYLRAWTEELGFSNPDQFFAKHLYEAAERTGDVPARFVSVGSGNCDTEVRVAKIVREMGLEQFTIECLDINQTMQERGRELAAVEGVAEHIVPLIGDFNQWQPEGRYTAVMANQALHHVVELEHLFDAIKSCLHAEGMFLISDMIGRNGHQRWPEALRAVKGFWAELPVEYRYNHQLKRTEAEFANWDCSVEGFEGVRAQDIMPLLLERFGFELFCPYSNVIDPFIDRSFGHHYDPNSDRDRTFIDDLQEFDETEIRAGRLTPTHMMAALCIGEARDPTYSRDIDPRACVRPPDARPWLPSNDDELLELFRASGGTDESYFRLHAPRHQAIKDRVVAGAQPHRVLEIGGHWLHQAARYALDDVEVLAVDAPASFERPEVRNAARRFGIRRLVEPTLENPTALDEIEESSVDLILFTEIIEHLAFNPVQLWKALYRVLAPGGRVIVTTPNYYSLRGRTWQPRRFARWGGGGIYIEDILGSHTYGQHWKEYSMAELVTYFRYLSTDFVLKDAQFMNRFKLPELHNKRARAAYFVERKIKWLRPQLYLELQLERKSAGIQAQPSW